MKQRYQWLDIAKGIAIILVVIGHVVSSYHSSKLYLDNNLFIIVHNFAYSFHMALFMIVSGFLFALSSKKRISIRSKEIKKKIINYGIPYVIFSFVWWIFKIVLASHANTQVSIYDLLLIPIYPISFMWFIYALLIMQLIQLFLEPKTLRYKVTHLLIAFAFLLLQPTLSQLLEIIHFEDLIICDVMKFYLYFLLGIYFPDIFESILKITWLKWGIFFLIFILMFSCNEYFSIENKIVKLLLALVGSYIVLSFSYSLKQNKILEFLGKNSLPIYVLHGLAIAATRSIITHLYDGSDYYGVFPLFLCSVMGVLIPVIIYLILRKIWKFDFIFSPGKYIKF